MTPKKEKEEKEEKKEEEEKEDRKPRKIKFEPDPEPPTPPVPVPEMPTLVSFNEFLGTLYKSQRFESVGGFVYWMKKQGIPKKLSIERWKEYFDEFVNRKV